MPRIEIFENLNAVIVYCMNVEFHSQWAKNYDKIKLVSNDLFDCLTAAKKSLT